MWVLADLSRSFGHSCGFQAWSSAVLIFSWQVGEFMSQVKQECEFMER